MIRRRLRSYSAISDINIANLVDVVLVLLIIFMISAPLLQSGIEVDLPRTKAAAISEEAEGVVITIDAKGGIYINDVWARMDEFEDTMQREMRAKGTESVYIRGDSLVEASGPDVLPGLPDLRLVRIQAVDEEAVADQHVDRLLPIAAVQMQDQASRGSGGRESLPDGLLIARGFLVEGRLPP